MSPVRWRPLRPGFNVLKWYRVSLHEGCFPPFSFHIGQGRFQMPRSHFRGWMGWYTELTTELSNWKNVWLLITLRKCMIDTWLLSGICCLCGLYSSTTTSMKTHSLVAWDPHSFVKTVVQWHQLTHLPLNKITAISQTVDSDAFSWMFFNWNYHKGPFDNNRALVQIMAWHRIGDKPLSEPMLIGFTDAYMRH